MSHLDTFDSEIDVINGITVGFVVATDATDSHEGRYWSVICKLVAGWKKIRKSGLTAITRCCTCGY